jgi:hypothetical protein
MGAKRRQELVLDAIESSIRMAGIAYLRLKDGAAAFLRDRGASGPPGGHRSALFLDAWSVVDCAKRLRSMAEQAPGVKRTPAVTALLDATGPVQDFRTYVQHLESEVVAVAGAGHPIWGALAWLQLIEKADGSRAISAMAVLPGRVAAAQTAPMINPAGKVMTGAIDHFHLSAGSQTISLTQIADAIAVFGGRFAKALQASGQAADDEDVLPIQIEIG